MFSIDPNAFDDNGSKFNDTRNLYNDETELDFLDEFTGNFNTFKEEEEPFNDMPLMGMEFVEKTERKINSIISSFVNETYTLYSYTDEGITVKKYIRKMEMKLGKDPKDLDTLKSSLEIALYVVELEKGILGYNK